MNESHKDDVRRIIGRVRRDEFVGRWAELQRLVAHGSRAENRALIIQAAPASGVSELLRQTFDELWRIRDVTIPIYFSLPQTNTTPVSAAIEFLNNFLLQYIAFRRDEPSLCQTALTLNELLELAPAADFDWIDSLVKNYKQQRFIDDDRQLIQFCLTAPRRIPRLSGHVFIMVDAMALAGYSGSAESFEQDLFRSLSFSNQPFALAGLRRDITRVVDRAMGTTDGVEKVHLNRLLDDEARDLVTSCARRLGVLVNDQTRDLMVQQLEGSPFFLTALLHAAGEKHLPLDSYFSFERLYVDELLGGALKRCFSGLLDQIVSDPEDRRIVTSLLCEAAPAGRQRVSVRAWQQKFGAGNNFERILARLHAEELLNWDGDSIDTTASPGPWKDYLRARFRLDALQEPRALVVADVMSAALKRAPHTIAKHYRRAANLKLRELFGRFNLQLVPRQLFYFDQFAHKYRGVSPEETAAGIAADTDLMRLPQVFHTADGVSFNPQLQKFGEEISVVAHAFDGSTYNDSSEIVWLAARLDSKLPVDLEMAQEWCDRLDSLARSSGFIRTQLWLISKEGFSEESSEMLRARSVYASSQQQFELLTNRLGAEAVLPPAPGAEEIELVLPMGSEYELLAATAAEQLARRLNFKPVAINQIKTAIVEACINASEHSLSPDRKIYQRFRVENDKLVITISSRGIVPAALLERADDLDSDIQDAGDQRRGWGLKLIKTLMDEVEFQRVDEGTSLRMIKYLRR